MKIAVHVTPYVRDRAGDVTAVLVLRSDPSMTLHPNLAGWPTASPSGETLLVRRSGHGNFEPRPLSRDAAAAPEDVRLLLPGLPEYRQNLERIVARLRRAGARVLLAGMHVPPNYGPEFARAFAAVYPAVARRASVALMPFLLEGVAADPRLNQADGIHPNAAGHQVIADRLWPHLHPLLRRAGAH